MSAAPDRAAAILFAADELFGERGYAAVSVRDIAQHAGVNKALVFYHHGSKEALFAKVVEAYYEDHRRALVEALRPDLPPKERVHTLLDAYLDYIEANQRYPRLVQQLVADPHHHALIARNLGGLLRFVEQALADIAPADGPLAARHLFLTLSGAVIHTFTYAPVLAEQWGSDPCSPEGLAERRVHLHRLTELLLQDLPGAAD